MKNLLPIVFLLVLISCNTEDSKKVSILKSPSSFFPEERPQVLIVGSFHFNYPGLDANKTIEEDKIDVLQEPKKSEVTELVEYIKNFKPNKIAIEAFDGWKAMEKFKKFKQGDYRNKRDERYQLGMRIATELQLDTLYSIDARSYDNELVQLDSLYFENFFKDFDFKSDDPYETMARNWLEHNDKMVSKTNLLEYFKNMNSKEYHQYDYGSYLIGDFKLDDTRGADILSVWWYNRNLRIFRKIQQLTENKDDRILLIFGNGHASVLRQILESSPEFEFVEFDSL